MKWLPHVDKLVLEMLANRTLPSCIQVNIYETAMSILPNVDVIKELPSLNHIKNLWTTLMLMTKTLAAYQIGHANVLRQLHTDETTCHQTSLVNVVLSYLTMMTVLKPSVLIVESLQRMAQLKNNCLLWLDPLKKAQSYCPFGEMKLLPCFLVALT